MTVLVPRLSLTCQGHECLQLQIHSCVGAHILSTRVLNIYALIASCVNHWGHSGQRMSLLLSGKQRLDMLRAQQGWD